MRLDIRYTTTFRYDDIVRESQNELRACPTTDDRQQLVAYRVTTSPAARTLTYTDYWGTRVEHFGLREPHLALQVIAEAAVDTDEPPAITSQPAIDQLDNLDFIDLHREYLHPTPHAHWGSPIRGRAEQVRADSGPNLVAVVEAIHDFVAGHLAYTPGSTEVGIETEDVYAGGVGVCQDYAHLAVAMCRSIGIPARYVSGYLFAADDATGADSESDLVHVQTHAWFEAAIPGAGWLALDPTNRQRVAHRHVKVGHGRDYDDVPPLRGVYSGSGMPEVDAIVEMRRMEPARQPTTTVPPPIPRPVDALRRRQEAQQQQQQ